MRSGDVSERVRLWRDAYHEFPNEPMVLHNLSWALRSENLTEHAEEIMSLSQRLLKEATQSGEYFGAINNLCRAYSDKGNIEEAKRYASMAGRYIGTENQLMIHILKGTPQQTSANGTLNSWWILSLPMPVSCCKREHSPLPSKSIFRRLSLTCFL